MTRSAEQRAKDAERKQRQRVREAMGLGLVDGLAIEPDDYWALDIAGLFRMGGTKDELRAAIREALTQWRATTIRDQLSRVTLGTRNRA